VQTRGFAAETCALDKGYDNNRVYGECGGCPGRRGTSVTVRV
jgi:hypothetical protein